MQVHEEVLRLLTATAAKLSAEQLANYLQATLQHSRKSRKCALAPNPHVLTGCQLIWVVSRCAPPALVGHLVR